MSSAVQLCLDLSGSDPAAGAPAAAAAASAPPGKGRGVGSQAGRGRGGPGAARGPDAGAPAGPTRRQQAATEILERRKARAGLLAFTRYTFTDYSAEPAHRLIAETLDQVLAGRITRLMIFAPPQHGKSELASVRLPAYWLGRRPNDPVILTSYAASLAYSKSRQARTIVESPRFNKLFPAVQTRPDSRAVDHWSLKPPLRGSLLAAGVGGPITGHGALLGIIDDPFENWQAAQSLAVRDTVWEWYRTTFRTRIWEGGAIVLIMTRWHEDDLAGRLLQASRPLEATAGQTARPGACAASAASAPGVDWGPLWAWGAADGAEGAGPAGASPQGEAGDGHSDSTVPDSACRNPHSELGTPPSTIPWTVLRLPAVAETQEERDGNDQRLGLPLIGQPDPLGRAPGEAVSPRRFSLAALAEIRKDVGSLAWAGEYQGSPIPLEGTMLKRHWFSVVETAPATAQRVRYWDKAGTAGAGAFTAGVLMAAANGLYYVLDVVRGQWSAGEREACIHATADRDAEAYGNSVTIFVEQEPADAGKESAQATIRNLAGFPAYADPAKGSKDTRLQPFAAQAEAGNVRLVRGRWNADYLDELCAVPAGRYRDQADATAGAFAKLARPSRPFASDP